MTMSNSSAIFRHIAVLAHPLLPSAIDESQKVAEFLRARHIQATIGLLNDEDLRHAIEEGQFDLVIALGGDGTMLRAGHLCARHKLPILGINLGKFGFLTELRKNQWPEFFIRLLDGCYWLEQRMMLCAEHWRADVKYHQWDVMNEVVVTRGAIIRPVHLTAEVDGHILTTYVADALIAATPTGSTAYALAAGGPILPPELRNILLVPVAPHLSIDRAIVLAEGSSVRIMVSGETQAVFSVDGQSPIELFAEDHVVVRAGDHTAQFIRFQEPGYFYQNLTQHMNRNPSTGKSR